MVVVKNWLEDELSTRPHPKAVATIFKVNSPVSYLKYKHFIFIYRRYVWTRTGNYKKKNLENLPEKEKAANAFGKVS